MSWVGRSSGAALTALLVAGSALAQPRPSLDPAAALFGAKKKSKAKARPGPKVLEATLLGIDAAAPLAELTKKYPRLHRHESAHGANWDACDPKESIRYVFYEEEFLSGRVATVSAGKVDSILCAHDGALLPELKAPVRTPRGIRLGATEPEIVALYGPPAEAHDNDGFRSLSYKRPLEVKGEEKSLSVVLTFELRQARLNGLRLVVEPRL